jgi:hypothetical protein
LLWVADPRRHRVFRVRDPLTNPVVDIVLGQTTVSGISCNQGLSQPSQNSLCHPGSVALDPQGNLYVSDHALEIEGNGRLLEFDASLFPANPATALFGIPASRVIGTNSSFTGPCVTMCGPFEATFSKSGVMVLGVNGYSGSRFPLVYPNPLVNENHTALQDYGSMPYAAVFDDHDNLYIVDKNRGRALVYHMPFPETTPPSLVTANVVPANEATDVPLNVNITLPFDEPVIAAGTAFSLTCGTPQAFTLTGSDTDTLILNPNANLPANTGCTVTGTAAGIADGAGNLLASDFTFHFTTVSDPGLPNQSPARNLFLTGTPTLTWTHLSWAVSYEVEIDSDKAFTQPRPNGYSAPLPSTGTSLTLPAPLPDGTYYFRVRGIFPTGVAGTYSTPEPFTIITGSG